MTVTSTLFTFYVNIITILGIEVHSVNDHCHRPLITVYKGPGGSMSQVVGLPNNSYKPITNTAWVRARLGKLQKWCTRLAVASDKAYQLLAYGRWFSPGTPAASTTKTGRHDISEILLKVALNTKNLIKSIITVYWSLSGNSFPVKPVVSRNSLASHCIIKPFL